MKNLIVKYLASAVLALTATSAAYANNDAVFPSSADDFSVWHSPAQLRYFEQRSGKGSVNLPPQGNTLPSASDEIPVWHSPAQLRYFQQREAIVAKEQKDRAQQSNSHYRPALSNNSVD